MSLERLASMLEPLVEEKTHHTLTSPPPSSNERYSAHLFSLIAIRSASKWLLRQNGMLVTCLELRAGPPLESPVWLLQHVADSLKTPSVENL